MEPQVLQRRRERPGAIFQDKPQRKRLLDLVKKSRRLPRKVPVERLIKLIPERHKPYATMVWVHARALPMAVKRVRDKRRKP